MRCLTIGCAGFFHQELRAIRCIRARFPVANETCQVTNCNIERWEW